MNTYLQQAQQLAIKGLRRCTGHEAGASLRRIQVLRLVSMELDRDPYVAGSARVVPAQVR